MKNFLLLLSMCLLATTLQAQTVQTTLPADDAEFIKNIDTVDSTAWKGVGVLSINASQMSLTNWAAGGDNSVAGTAALTYSLDYEHNRSLWMNRLELGYGLNKTETNGLRKTADKIYFNSMYGYKIVEHWYASFFVNFQSQFAKGYNYSVSTTTPISRFMAPGYLKLGPGITWMPKEWFIMMFSPASWSGTFVLDDDLSALGAYGVKPGKHLLSEFGADLKLIARFDPMENVSVYSRLEFYSNYLEKPQNIDIHWDTFVTMKINQWLSANLNFSMVYDDNVKFVKKPGAKPVAKIQFKEVFGLGFMVAF